MRKGFTLIELMIVIAIIAIIAAIAIPNLLESRVTANEAAASSSLKSGIFPAQVQFQGGGYLDRDADNVGEYGTIGMLAGASGTPKISSGQIKLVTGPMASGAGSLTSRSANGYQFVGVAPSETNTGTQATIGYVNEGDDGAALTAVAGANNGERNFIVGCAPDRYSDTGRRVFALTHDGQVRSPALAIDQNVWYGGTAPASGDAIVQADIVAGMADVFGLGSFAGGSNMSNASTAYPTYSR